MLWIAVGIVMLVGCDSRASTTACSSTIDISSILYGLTNGSDIVGAMTSSELHNDIERSLYALDALDVDASDAIKRRTQQVRLSFQELSKALDKVEWDIAAVATNSNVQAAMTKFGDKVVSDAIAVVNEYTQSLCGVSTSLPAGDASGSTLPLPEQPSPTATDPPMGVTDNASDARATGVLVATLFGLTITDAQVNCLGSALQGIVDVSSATASIEQYQGQFQKAFDTCAIDFKVPTN